MRWNILGVTRLGPPFTPAEALPGLWVVGLQGGGRVSVWGSPVGLVPGVVLVVALGVETCVVVSTPGIWVVGIPGVTPGGPWLIWVTPGRPWLVCVLMTTLCRVFEFQ